MIKEEISLCVPKKSAKKNRQKSCVYVYVAKQKKEESQGQQVAGGGGSAFLHGRGTLGDISVRKGTVLATDAMRRAKNDSRALRIVNGNRIADSSRSSSRSAQSASIFFSMSEWEGTIGFRCWLWLAAPSSLVGVAARVGATTRGGGFRKISTATASLVTSRTVSSAVVANTVSNQLLSSSIIFFV